jgi:predicted Zn-dependent protease
MNPYRRAAIVSSLAALAPVLALSQNQPVPGPSVVDSVALYVLPTDGVAEQAAAQVARALAQDTGLWVKATVWVPPGPLEPLPGGSQFAGEDYLALGSAVARRLQDAGPRTWFIVLTDRDINARSQSFRFQFSMHSPMQRTSVLSVARLLYARDGTPAPGEVVSARAQKMLMRIAGEMRLGWQRSSDPADLMYAPIMSVDDIDRMDVVHTVQVRQPAQ